MYENVRIETERLIVRSFKDSDINELCKIASDEGLSGAVPFGREINIEGCKILMASILDFYTKSTVSDFKGFLLAVVSKNNNECVGVLGLFPVGYDANENDLFYGIIKEYCGKGYGTELGKAIVNYAFNNINITKIVSTVNKDNEISKKVLEKIGMSFEQEIKGVEDDYNEGALKYSIKKHNCAL